MERVHLITKAFEAPSFRVSQLLAVWSKSDFAAREHWLRAETDRQLRIAFDMIEPQLETNADGEIRYLRRGAHGDEGLARLLMWFEIWSEDRRLLMRSWPVPEERIYRRLEAPMAKVLHFHTVELEPFNISAGASYPFARTGQF